MLAAAALPSGGTTTTVLQELVQSGFVHESPPRNHKRKEALYRLADEYSLFYLNWIQPNRTSGRDIWLRKAAGPKYASWCGYAFEMLCLKHVPQIKAALGIAAVETSESAWLHRARSPAEEGAQIDLCIDRRDHCTNLCEVKFTQRPFVIDKRYAAELARKLRVFRDRTRTSNTLFLTLITTHGVQPNRYSQELVAAEVRLRDLMGRPG